MTRHVWVTGEGTLAGLDGRITVDCHRRLRGPYTGAGSVLRLMVPEIIASEPALARAHRIEIAALAPELRDALGFPPQEFTEVPKVAVRVQDVAYTGRLAHGVIDLLLAWSGHAGPLALGFAGVDEADPTDREFLAILLRRAPESQISVTIATRATRIDGELGAALARYAGQHPAVPVAPVPDGRTKEELARAFVWSDCTSQDPAEERAWDQLESTARQRLHDQRATELDHAGDWSLRLGALPYHREHGSTASETAGEYLLQAAEYCLAMGFFHALLDLGLRGLAVTDPARHLNRYWLLSGKTGTAHAVLGLLDEAERFYTWPRALSALPMLHLNNSYSLAMLALRRGQPEEVATAHLNNAIAIASGLADPVDATYYAVISEIGLALVDLEAGRLPEALARISAGTGRLDAGLPTGKYLAHRSVFAYQKATVLIRLGWLDEAAGQLSAAIGLDPGYPQYYLDRASVLAKLDRTAEAIADFAAAQERTPPFWELHENRAAVLAEAGDLDGAIADLARVIELAPGQAGALCARAQLHAEQGDTAQALADFGAALAADGGLIPALAGRAALSYEAADYDAAIDDLSRALDQGADSDLRYNRAAVYQETGDWQAAIDDYDQALVLPGADREEILRERAKCAARLAASQVLA